MLNVQYESDDDGDSIQSDQLSLQQHNSNKFDEPNKLNILSSKKSDLDKFVKNEKRSSNSLKNTKLLKNQQDEEERKSSQENSSVYIKPNIIKNESSSNEYATDEDQSKSLSRTIEVVKQKKGKSDQFQKPLTKFELQERDSNDNTNMNSNNQQPAELEEIVQMFAHDLQQSIRQRFKNKALNQQRNQGGTGLSNSAKKLPLEIQALMGQANNLYAFEKFDEAIDILQQIITKLPDHAESYSTIASIYEEMNEYEKSLNFGVMAAFLLKTDVERWQKCASIAKFLQKLPIAIYCLNRAIKQSSLEDVDEILRMKFEKIGIYKMQNDYSSAIRTLQKLINKFHTQDLRKSYMLNMALAQTYFEQGQPQKSFEVLDELIELNQNDSNYLIDILLLYGDISQSSQKYQEFVNQMKRVSIQDILRKLKQINDYKIKIFQIEVRKFLCLIDSGETFNLSSFQESINQFYQNNLTDKLDQYQRVVSSIIMLADKLENRVNDIANTTKIYETLLSMSLQIDQPNILYKLGLLYQKTGDNEKAKEALEQAFIRCPIVQNAQIRIELSTVYNQLGMNKKAMSILKNPFPQQQAANQNDSTMLKKRKRKPVKSKDEDIIMSSESEQEEDEVIMDMSDSWNIFKPPNMINMQPPSLAGAVALPSNSLNGSDHTSEAGGTFSDSIMRPDFRLKKDVNYQKKEQAGQQQNDRDFLLKRNRKLQKRLHGKKDQVEENQFNQTQDIIQKMKQQLQDFNAGEYIMLMEQCKLYIKLEENDQLGQSLENKFIEVLKNMKIKQDLQDLMYKQNLYNNSETPLKEQFFMRKFNADSDKDGTSKVTQQAKIQIIDEIDQYPNILTQIKPDEIIDITFNYLKMLIQKDLYNQAAEIVDIFKSVELLMQAIQQNETKSKIFYEIATIVYYQSQQPIKAYKALRQISNHNDMLNWAMMGCIISKHEDSSFCRSYFKRVFQTKQVLNPFILMILGNNYLQKQQIELAIKHYWLLHKSFHTKNSLLNLTLAISYLSQSYQRTNEDKEQSVKRSIALFMKYAEARDDKIEVQYNIARAFQFMGLNINAREIYENLIKLDKTQLNDDQKQIQIQAVFNLSQLIKGSGLNTGITITEGANIERIKYNNLRLAHELIINNIIIE